MEPFDPIEHIRLTIAALKRQVAECGLSPEIREDTLWVKGWLEVLDKQPEYTDMINLFLSPVGGIEGARALVDRGITIVFVKYP